MTSLTTRLVIGLAFNLMFTALQTLGQSTLASSATTFSSTQSQCTYTWTMTQNTNYAGGAANSAATLADCQTACINSDNCVAIDFNTVSSIGQQCYLLTSLSGTKFSSAGINHYDLTRNCESTCSPTWTSTADTNYRGGTANTAANLADCKAACIGSSGCIAIDFNSVASVGQQCWLLYTLGGGRLSNAGITHYDLTLNCPVAYYAYFSKTGQVLRVNPASNSLFTVADYNQMTLFTESTCLSQSISNLNNTASCVSLSPWGSSNSYVYLNGNVELQLLTNITTDRSKEDSSFAIRRSTYAPGYIYLQPSAAYRSPLALVVKSPDSIISLTDYLSQDEALFYRTAVYIPSQPVTGTCSNVWSRISGAYRSPSSSLGPMTLSKCFATCLLTANCTGVNTIPSSSSSSNVNCSLCTRTVSGISPDPNYVYYELTATAPYQCPRGCMYSFSYQANANVTAYTASTDATIQSAYNCRLKCTQTSGCFGYNYNSLSCVTYVPSGSSTFAVLSLTLMTRTLAKCGCGPIIYTNFNTSDANAVQASGVSGFDNCRTACVNNLTCTGFDLRNNACYLSMTPVASTVLITNTSFVHVEVTRQPCGNGCQDKWDLFANTDMTGNTQYNAATESACRLACQTNSTCTAIAWNYATNSCFLATSSSLRNLEGTAPGWNTYNLYRVPTCDIQ